MKHITQWLHIHREPIVCFTRTGFEEDVLKYANLLIFENSAIFEIHYTGDSANPEDRTWSKYLHVSLPRARRLYQELGFNNEPIRLTSLPSLIVNIS